MKGAVTVPTAQMGGQRHLQQGKVDAPQSHIAFHSSATPMDFLIHYILAQLFFLKNVFLSELRYQVFWGQILCMFKK